MKPARHAMFNAPGAELCMRRSFTRRQEWTKKLIASRMGEQLVTVQDLFGHHRTEGIVRSYWILLQYLMTRLFERIRQATWEK